MDAIFWPLPPPPPPQAVRLAAKAMAEINEHFAYRAMELSSQSKSDPLERSNLPSLLSANHDEETIY
jgi:hypothetical protein